VARYYEPFLESDGCKLAIYLFNFLKSEPFHESDG